MSAIKADSAATGKPGGGDRFRKYWEELKYEWAKITWPDIKQWKQSTYVVFIFAILLMLILSLFDLAVGFVLDGVLQIGA